MTSVAIVGAGLAGLRAAITLQDAGVDCEIYESSDRAGGRVATDVIDGFILDRGFQLINSGYSEIRALNLLSELEFQKASRGVRISLGDRQIALSDPRKNPFTSLNSATGSIAEKFRFLTYLRTPSRTGYSVEDELISCGVLYQCVLKPFLIGVFFAQPSSIDAVIGKEIIKTFISGDPGLPARGAGALPGALAKRVRKIHYGASVDSLSQFEGRPVIVATDLTTAAQLLDIPNVPKLATSTTWYHEVPSGISSSRELLIDGQSRGPVVNSIILSNAMPSYAPIGRHLMSTTTIAITSESEVRRHLSLLWKVDTSEWQMIAKYEIPKSLPLFGVGVSAAQSAHIRNQLYVAGDWRTAPSQNGALISGRLAAQEILQRL